MPYSKIKNEIASLLQKNGYLAKVEIKEAPDKKKTLTLSLRYDEGEPVIDGIKRISKTGQRIYSDSKNFERYGGRRGMIVVSTSKGIMSHFRARKENLGGEVVCTIY